MRNDLFVLMFSFVFVGCAVTSSRPADDARPPPADAGPVADSATSDTAPTFDAGALPDAGACDLRWLDATPSRFAADLDHAPVLVADSVGFGALYTYPDSDRCLGYCVADAVLDASGGFRTWESTWFPHDVASAPALHAARAATGEVGIAVVSGAHVWWAEAPSADAWPLRTELDVTGTVDAAAFERDALLVHTATSAGGARLRDSRVARISADGTQTPISGLDPTFGSEFWEPRLVTSSAGPWLGALMDVDFPPTVQLAGPSGGGWDGSSCGVESYDLFAESGSSVVVAEDCGSTLHVVRRDAATPGPRPEHTFVDRSTSAHVPSHAASAAGRFVVVYRAASGSARVAVLDGSLALLASADVPGSAGDPALVGPVAIAASEDGTFAVLTSERWVSVDNALGEVSVQRFALCP